MYKITWDIETGGVMLHSRIVDGTLGTSPRPVFWEELDLLKLNELGWSYPHCDEPLLWAVNKQYWYRGEMVFEAKGANIINFLTWGDVDISKKGVVSINVKGVKAQLRYDANIFEPAIETIELTDKRLSNVWGDKIYRLSLKAKTATKAGVYKYEITKLK